MAFTPFFLFSNSHTQTIIGSFMGAPVTAPPSHSEFVLLSDKDQLAMEVSTPKKWKNTDPTVVLVHGLCGSHKSAYLVRLARKLKRKNGCLNRRNL